MRVVFLSYAFPPLKYPRSIQIYRLVKHSAHAVRVVCCAGGPSDDQTIDEGIAGKPAERIALPPPARAGLASLTDRFGVPDQFRSWALHAANVMLERDLIGPDDVLVTFAQPMSDHVAGLRIKRALGVRWIAHFSDPWTDNPYRHDVPGAGLVNRSLERAVMAEADRIVFTSRETVDLVLAKYPREWRRKTAVLPHAFDAELFDRDASALPARPLVGRYIGEFYSHRTPRPLLEALEMLVAEQPETAADLRIEFVGAMSERARRVHREATLPERLVDFLDPVDYTEALRLMRAAHFLIVIDAPAETSVFLPSKLIDYLGAARPVLAISPPGASAELVTRLGGYVADPTDVDAVLRQLRATLEHVRSNADANFGDPTVRAEYAAPVVVREFDALIDSVRTDPAPSSRAAG